MKRVLLIILGISLCTLIIGALVRFVFVRKGADGEIRIEADPQVKVTVDGKEVGSSPYQSTIAPGEHLVKLSSAQNNPGYPWESKIVIGQSLLTYIHANLGSDDLHSAVDLVWLEKINGKETEFSLTSSPTGSALFLDNESKGLTPVTQNGLSVGAHQISLSMPGFLTRSLKVKALEGYRLHMHSKMATSGVEQENTVVSETSATSSAQIMVTPTGITSKTNPKNQTGDTVTILDTPTGFLRIRSEPSTGASEAGRLSPGDTVALMEEKTGWYKITTDKNIIGWISTQYAKKNK
jgi:hypothetical protein